MTLRVPRLRRETPEIELAADTAPLRSRCGDARTPMPACPVTRALPSIGNPYRRHRQRDLAKRSTGDGTLPLSNVARAPASR